MIRRIMHIDMDAFYASVEQSDRPELKGRPVIVGGSKRGVVSAASYEARKFGVRSAMPVFEARRLCPQGVFLPVRMSRYKEVSRLVMEVLSAFSPTIEQVSIDEAYLDVTGAQSLHGEPRAMSLRIKADILERTFLTCSVGVAPCKFLAKIASEMNKPDGLTIIERDDAQSVLETLPVGKVPGVGKKTAQTLLDLGVHSASDILRFPRGYWIKKLGKIGMRLYERAQGIDDSPVTPHAEAKSRSAEDTFVEDTDDVSEMKRRLMIQAESLGRDLREDGVRGRTITLKLKYHDFKLITRSRTLREPTDCTNLIFETAAGLLEALKPSRKVRLIGIGISGLSSGAYQKSLFEDPELIRQRKIDRAVDQIRERFGEEALKRGVIFGSCSE